MQVLVNYIPYLGYIISQCKIKPNWNIVQGIMYIRMATTSTEMKVLMGIFQYYGDILSQRFHVIAPMLEVSTEEKGREILCNNNIEDDFKYIKKGVPK